ncbi:hypothetical protein A8709_25880 [Paenibacillus pectinilyticus]|uniref:Prepilin-type N-terminal cleavage/methylation domain-containing protein n=1 Tax=Paenibacillus pectinilyticus TaxID=512399 RepID=A0A1C1A157_9BACL|nr:type II secretion system protein [Paenibacillus pectinilyticus]OCT14262.1 hypothetical protein A8709_25880 [Paenibacillus pectinilyticus]
MLIKMMNRLKKEEKGFTLIELLAVIVILAVIAAIAVPYILGVIDKSKKDADVALFHQVYEASRLYITSEVEGSVPLKVNIKSKLVASHYLDSNIVLPSTKDVITAGKLDYDTDGQLVDVVISTSTKSFKMDAAGVIASKGTIVDVTGTAAAYPTEN